MLSQFHLKKTKRGVSIMIGYILLITFVIAISVFVYQWLKTYVPKEGLACPDGVSIFVSDYTFDNSELSLKIKNNGKFNIGGIYIYYSDDPNKKIASKDLSKVLIEGVPRQFFELNPGVKFLGALDDENPIGPSQEIEIGFDVTGISGEIKSIE